MTYRIELRPVAMRELAKLETSTRRYRVRCGDYRIIYEIEDRVLIILVLRIGHRRQVYR
jgi:mRNA interferase RelE/StbE